MSGVDHKTKMISLRLSEAEFDFLRTRYLTYGARNLSDLARLAVQRLMYSWDSSGNHVAEKVVALDRRVTDLESELAFIRSRVKVTADTAQEDL